VRSPRSRGGPPGCWGAYFPRRSRVRATRARQAPAPVRTAAEESGSSGLIVRALKSNVCR
jgi:hypothetical protein